MEDPNRIRYYAQELKVNTYNLTRMNLVMRGILPDNIVTRNGDTLEEKFLCNRMAISLQKAWLTVFL